MKFSLYIVWDIIARTIVGNVMHFHHDAPVIREFTEALANPQSLGRRPGDYELRWIGEFDQSAGALTQFLDPSATEPRVVLTGSAWLAAQQPVGQPELVREA